MKRTRIATVLSAAVVVLGVAAAFGTGGRAHAQQPAPSPQRVFVTVTILKPEMILTNDDLMRSVAVPAFKKASVPWYWTLSTAGPSGQNYRRVTLQPIANFAQLDEPSAIARVLGADGNAVFQAKERQTFVSRHVFVQTFRPDLSIQSGSTTLPARVVMQTLQLINDKGPEFTKVMVEGYLPNYKTSGVKDLWVYATTFGAPAQRFMVLAPINKYADLDIANPVQIPNVPGSASAAAIASRQALLVSLENDILTVVPDLSYGTPRNVTP